MFTTLSTKSTNHLCTTRAVHTCVSVQGARAASGSMEAYQHNARRIQLESPISMPRLNCICSLPCWMHSVPVPGTGANTQIPCVHCTH